MYAFIYNFVFCDFHMTLCCTSLPCFCVAGITSALYYPNLILQLGYWLWMLGYCLIWIFDSPNVDSKKEVLLKYIWLLSLRLWEFWTSGTWITQDTSILKRILYWNASYCSGFFWSQRIETQFKEIWNKRALIGTLNKEVQRFSLFEAQLDSLARFW